MAFKPFFLTYLRWGTKDNLLSNIPIRNVVSSTTGIGLLSRKKKVWRHFLADKHTECLCLRESKTVFSCPLLAFIQTKLQLTLNDTHIGRSVANLKITDIYRAINTRF